MLQGQLPLRSPIPHDPCLNHTERIVAASIKDAPVPGLQVSRKESCRMAGQAKNRINAMFSRGTGPVFLPWCPQKHSSQPGERRAAIFLLSGEESPDPSGFCMTDNERAPVSETPATVTEAAEKKPRPRRTTQTRTARSARTTKTVKRAPTTRTRSIAAKAAPESETQENDKISLADFMATVSSSDPKQETGLLAVPFSKA